MEGRGQDFLETQGMNPAGQLAVSSQTPSWSGQTLTPNSLNKGKQSVHTSHFHWAPGLLVPISIQV